MEDITNSTKKFDNIKMSVIIEIIHLLLFSSIIHIGISLERFYRLFTIVAFKHTPIDIEILKKKRYKLGCYKYFHQPFIEAAFTWNCLILWHYSSPSIFYLKIRVIQSGNTMVHDGNTISCTNQHSFFSSSSTRMPMEPPLWELRTFTTMVPLS